MLHAPSRSKPTDDPRGDRLRAALAEAAHALPAQGPISVFVHHNTLHSLTHLPFHDAIATASVELDAQGYLGEDAYRAAYARGRIDDADLDAALREHLHAIPHGHRARPLGPKALCRIALLHPLPVLSEAALAWQIEERGALARMRPDVPAGARASFLERSLRWMRTQRAAGDLERAAPEHPRASLEADVEGWALAALWHACRGVRSRARAPRSIADRVPSERSHRDLLLQVTGVDPARLVNPWLVRFCAAFLDQGMAAWSMPGRERGMLACFREELTTGWLPLPSAVARARGMVRDQVERGLDAEATVLEALEQLGVPPSAWSGFLTRVLLALPGWAGMVHRLEEHPEEREGSPAPSLLELTAIRLTLDRAAWARVAEEELGFQRSLAELPRFVASHGLVDAPERPAKQEASFRLFGLAQLAGLTAEDLGAMRARDKQALVDRLDAFDELTRRRIWQEAYEAHHREEALEVLHCAERRRRRRPRVAPARWQLTCCIDDRAESLRRHVEEVAPDAETFGVAGFYGLAIEYVGIDGARGSALCPAGVVPGHAVHEVPEPEHETWADARRARRAAIAKLSRITTQGTRDMVGGVLMTPLAGVAAAFPLVTRLLFPLVAERIRRHAKALLLPTPKTSLTHTRQEEEAIEAAEVREARPRGFTLREQVDRVAATLENMGLTRAVAPLVITLGHGSVSVNNPHESAYDCGACSGRHGGPNGRLFAALCNRPDVRRGLRERGIDIPDGTWFVGGLNNTANDEVVLYDTEEVPEALRPLLAEVREALDVARARDAHERCRRFDDTPLDLSPEAALRSVEARVGDLSQTRPEYNHATNSLCIVGRRSLTRGVFLDRRAFLVSYDPESDPDGTILERVLVAVGPVGTGISLEYYFSSVDNDRFGAGTKTPHNLSGLLGVMDGHASDLRTGLTAEMVEIHEPMRLLTVVESKPEVLLAIARRQPKAVGELVLNAWMQLVTIDPDDGTISRYVPSKGAFVRWEPRGGPVPIVRSSMAHYTGERGCLPLALIDEEAAHA